MSLVHNRMISAFEEGYRVMVIGGTYEKAYDFYATVTAECSMQSSYVSIKFDRPQIGYSTMQRMRGAVFRTKLAKHNVKKVEVAHAKVVSACPYIYSVIIRMDSMTLEDVDISNELRLRIRDVCKTMKRSGMKKGSPSVHTLIAIGMNELDNCDSK